MLRAMSESASGKAWMNQQDCNSSCNNRVPRDCRKAASSVIWFDEDTSA